VERGDEVASFESSLKFEVNRISSYPYTDTLLTDF